MSHWLDDAARGLAQGRFSRRQVIRRGGTIAAGALAGSIAGPFDALARAASNRSVPCPGFDEPCASPDVCCGGDHCCDAASEICCGGSCLPRHGRIGCCHDSSYDTHTEHCCPSGAHHACFNDETCCGTEGCCKHDETCCAGVCVGGGTGLGCCHGSTYDTRDEHCCPEFDSHHGVHACFNDETCCGTSECCGKDQDCCHSGNLKYCAPKGQCCPSGEHRVTCGSGKSLCCPEGEYCRDGHCEKPGPPHHEHDKCGNKPSCATIGFPNHVCCPAAAIRGQVYCITKDKPAVCCGPQGIALLCGLKNVCCPAHCTGCMETTSVCLCP